MRCPSCHAASLPACAGEGDPTLCSHDRADECLQRSRFLSSVRHGWPKAADVIDRESPDQAPQPIGRMRLLIDALADAHTFYGQFADVVARGMEQRGVPVGVRWMQQDERFLSVPAMLRGRRVTHDPLGLGLLQLVNPHHLGPGRRGRTARFTMWETTRISPNTVAALNQCQVVIVPCEWNRNCFAECGVVAPMDVVPLGLDLADGYDRAVPPDADRFVVMMAGNTAHGGERKNLQAGVDAWIDALGERADCELRVKVIPDNQLDRRGHPRVIVHRDALTPRKMARWYEGGSVYLCPSRAEGWGKHTQEAMCKGLVPIAALWGGTAAFCDESVCLPLEHALEEAHGKFYAEHSGGLWCSPTHDSMVDQLRWCYAHRDALDRMRPAVMARGRSFTWSKMNDGILAVLERRGIFGR